MAKKKCDRCKLLKAMAKRRKRIGAISASSVKSTGMTVLQGAAGVIIGMVGAHYLGQVNFLESNKYLKAGAQLVAGVAVPLLVPGAISAGVGIGMGASAIKSGAEAANITIPGIMGLNDNDGMPRVGAPYTPRYDSVTII